MKNPPLKDEWQTFRKEIFTPEEIAESDLRVSAIGDSAMAGWEQALSQTIKPPSAQG